MMHFIRKTTMDLPCSLTREEQLDAADAVALALEGASDVVARHEAQKTRMKQEKIDAEAKVAAVSKVCRQRKEYRIVNVEILVDHHRGEEYTIRLDIGQVWNVKTIPNQERIDPQLATATDQPSQVALDAIERQLASRGEEPEDPAVEASLVVYDKLVALDDHQYWPAPGAIEGWTSDERLSVLAWAEDRQPGEVAPDVLKTWMATHDEPEPSPAAQVKACIHQQGEDDTSRADLRVFFDDASLASFSSDFTQNGDDGAKLDRVLWALVHAKEVRCGRGQAGLAGPDELFYTATHGELTFDVDRMLAAQPELGTEDGLPEDEIVWIDLAAPEVEPVDIEAQILAYVGERETPTTMLDIGIRFQDGFAGVPASAIDSDSIPKAIVTLIDRGDLEEGGDGFSPVADDAEKGGGA